MTKADGVVIALALVVLGYLYAAFWSNTKGAEAAILVDGVETQRWPLTQDRRIDITGRMGVSQLEIKDGKVRFLASPCSGKQCVHAGRLHRSGEFAACLPNGVSVYVVGSATEFDAINF